MTHDRFDVGILTVIGIELEAVQKALGIDHQRDRFQLSGANFWRCQRKSGGDGAPITVVVHCIGEPGQQAASAAGSRMIARFNTKMMLLVGIAAGRKKKVKIGDVAIPRAIVDSTIKVADAGLLKGRPKIPPIPYVVQQMVVAFRLDSERWHSQFRAIFGRTIVVPPGKESEYKEYVAEVPNLHDVVIASDNVLLRDAEVLERGASELHQHIRIGEMEAAGFVTACEGQYPSVPWFVVRGISDFGDDFKNDEFHRLASCAAASYAAEFVDNGFDAKLIGDHGSERLAGGESGVRRREAPADDERTLLESTTATEPRNDISLWERLAATLAGREAKKVREGLTTLARLSGGPVSVETKLVASEATAALADLSESINERRKLRAKGTAICRSGWNESADRRFAVLLADRVVEQTFDAYGRPEDADGARDLRDATKALESAMKSPTEGSLSELLIKKSSVLRTRAFVAEKMSDRQQLTEAAIRCAQKACDVSNRSASATLALGQTKWAAARWHGMAKSRELLAGAETELLAAAVTADDPVSLLVLSRFFRLNGRPLQAVRIFARYILREKRRWRANLEAHLCAESAIQLANQGFSVVLVQRATETCLARLRECVAARVGGARSCIALAQLVGITGSVDDSSNFLLQLRKTGGTDWNSILEQAEKSLTTDAAHVGQTFLLGMAEASTWVRLGTYALRIQKDPVLARRWYEVALGLEPSSEVLTNLARLLANSDDQRDVLEATNYIERARGRTDGTWMWWRPVRRKVDEARSRLGLTPLSSISGPWSAVEESFAAAEAGRATAKDVLTRLVETTPGIEMSNTELSVTTPGLSFSLGEDGNGREVHLRSESRTLNISLEDLGRVVHGKSSVGSLLDQLTADWRENEIERVDAQ